MTVMVTARHFKICQSRERDLSESLGCRHLRVPVIVIKLPSVMTVVINDPRDKDANRLSLEKNYGSHAKPLPWYKFFVHVEERSG